jgi:hypothetical protein
MHDAGLVHVDLNLKNILVQHPWTEPRIFIIDLDGAELRGEVPLSVRLDNLVRLDRSIVKWPASRNTVSLHDRIRTWKSYVARCPDGTPPWEELLRRRATRHIRHALGRK